jgi:hypothetical protein
MAAHLFASKWNSDKWQRAFLIMQLSASLLLLVVSALVNTWAFPIHTTISLMGLILLLAIAFYFLLTKMLSTIQKAFAVSVTSIALFFFLANTNFYPQLLAYQAGKSLADGTRGIVDPRNVYFWKNTFSSSYNFYSASHRRVYPDSLEIPRQKFWLIYEKSQQQQIDSVGFVFGKIFSVPDYEITRLKKNFIDPATRKQTLDSMIMAEVTGRID